MLLDFFRVLGIGMDVVVILVIVDVLELVVDVMVEMMVEVMVDEVRWRGWEGGWWGGDGWFRCVCWGGGWIGVKWLSLGWRVMKGLVDLGMSGIIDGVVVVGMIRNVERECFFF